MIVPIPNIAFLDAIGGPELLLILVVVLIFFGGEKLPELARGMGKAINEFKKAASDVEHEFKRAMDEAPDKPAQTFLKPAPNAIPQAAPAATPVPAPEAKTPQGDHGIEA